MYLKSFEVFVTFQPSRILCKVIQPILEPTLERIISPCPPDSILTPTDTNSLRPMLHKTRKMHPDTRNNMAGISNHLQVEGATRNNSGVKVSELRVILNFVL